MGTTTRIQSFCLLALLVSVRAAAFELEDGRLSINGFGSWGYGWSNHGNNYSLAQPKGNFGNGSFALALAARLSDRAVAGAQVRLSSDGKTSVDWVFGEWRFSDRASLRVGVLKHPFAIFGEVTRVGILRTFYLLPRGLYGSSEFTGLAVDGLSLGGSLGTFSGWSLSYDLYGGLLQLSVSNLLDKLDPGTLQRGGKLVTAQEETKYIAGGRIVAATPIDGLDIRLSSYGTIISETNGPRFVVGPSIQYLGEKLSVRAEYFFLYEQGQRARDRQRTHTAYVEAAYFLTQQIQIGVHAEIYQLNLMNGSTSSLLYHRELAATFNYWFTPGWVIKAGVHGIDGNRFAAPLALDDALVAGGIYRQTLAYILGSQFSF
jgi:hypothetical protein